MRGSIRWHRRSRASPTPAGAAAAPCASSATSAATSTCSPTAAADRAATPSTPTTPPARSCGSGGSATRRTSRSVRTAGSSCPGAAAWPATMERRERSGRHKEAGMRVKLWAIFVGLAILAWGAAPSAAESGAVHGVVRENAAGSRMPGVRVVAIPEALKPGALLPQGVTSQEGAFEIRGVEPGRYRLVYHVDALGWSEEKDTVTVEEGRTAHVECEIDLAQVTGTLAARVVVESDEPLSGRAIVSMAGPLAGQIQRTAPVERDGSFRLGGLPAGRYSVQATVGGRLASTTAEVAIGQEAVVELRLAEENSAVYEGSNITLSAATVSGRGSARSMAASWLVLPEDGIELGTSLSFLFAPGASGGAQMPGM